MKPAGRMTPRRLQMQARYRQAVDRGEKVLVSRLARECGIDDWRNAKRILRDLKNMGALA